MFPATTPMKPTLRLATITSAVIALALLTLASPSLAADGFAKVALPKIPSRTVSLADFGAVGDGAAMNTDAFARAIAALSAKGGGKLVVPPGIWLTGPVRLQSNIELHLERGAVIQFARDINLYPLMVINMKGEKEVDSISPIFGQDLENVAITGYGIIDGGGDAWRSMKKGKPTEGEWNALVKSGGVLNDKGDTWYPSKAVMIGETKKIVQKLRETNCLDLAQYEPYHQVLRPKMLRLIGCKKVLLQDFIIQNPPNWTMNPALCENVSILNVQVRNSPLAQNSDALDLESCRHAIIRGCIFDDGDDGICIKSGKDAAGRRIGVPTEDVLVDGCIVYHAHGGFTIGSEMSGGVRNMLVTNCTFIGTDVGLRFKSNRGRGGVVENIRVTDIRMADIVGDAINFDLYYGNKSTLESGDSNSETNTPAVSEETPAFRDIHITNVVCRGAHKAIVLQGLPEMPVRNITLKNVSITSQQGVSVTDADGITFDNVSVESKAGGEVVKTVRVANSKLDLAK